MAAYFFDSSALVKRFARETGTAWVINLLKPAGGNRIYIARITYVEVVSAIIRRVKNNSLSIVDGGKIPDTIPPLIQSEPLKDRIIEHINRCGWKPSSSKEASG